jgi:hypothetical protein
LAGTFFAVLGPKIAYANALLASVVAEYPNAHLIDANAYFAGHSEWIAFDGLHFSPAGQAAYASLISATLDSAGIPSDPPVPTTTTSTSVPDTTTSVPDTTTSVPDTTTSVPDTTTSVPDTTTSVPDTTTSVPDTTTSVPDTTTSIAP